MAGQIHLAGVLGPHIDLNAPILEVTLSVAAAIWKFLGTELAIFAITVFFLVIIKNTKVKQVASKFCGGALRHAAPLGKGAYAASTTDKCKAAPRVPLNRQQRRVPAVDTVVPCSRPADNNTTRSLRESYGAAVQREPWRLVDEICCSTHANASAWAASQNIELYKELQLLLVSSGTSLGEACCYSRHSTFDLYSCMVQNVVRTSQCHLVERLLEDMARQGITRSLSFYEAAMKQLAGQKQYQIALNVYDHLVKDGLTPSNVTYSCLVSFAAELGEYERALSFFEMLSASTTPSIRAYMTVLRVHAKRQDWTASLATFRGMQRRGVTLDSLVLNVVLATGVSADKVEEADALVMEGDAASPRITDVVSYNTLVKGYLQRSDLATAVGLIDRMQQVGIKPNAITFNTMIERAARGFQMNGQAWQLLSKMRSCGLKPDRLTCSILVRGLGKHPNREQLQDAADLLQEARACCDPALLSNLQGIVLEGASRAGESRLLADLRLAFAR
jgi:pentatricopeptide repeat protein